jgi:hypothetical protein
VRHAARDGKYLGELPLPAQLRFAPDGKTGPRPNLVFEGLGFARDGHSLWVALEAPLFEDGAEPTTTHGAFVRFTRFARDGQLQQQVAYPLDAIPVEPGPGKFADNGMSEVLPADNELLVLERAGVQGADGVFRFHVRLYAADPTAATDVQTMATLTGASFRPVPKRLLADFDHVRPGGSDNLEGLAWGRALPNGHATLVLVSDDNFNATQSTQRWVFEVLPSAEPAASHPARQWDDPFEGVVQDERRIAGFVGEYRWLSNYFPCAVTYEGRTYGSS